MASNGELRGTAILDIRRDQIGVSILDDMRQQLRPIDGKEKRMPTMLLYDEKGLKLFEEITYLDEYYLTNAEISVLEKYADNIVERVQAGSQVIELGSGNLRKTIILLQAFERARKDIDYYALDLSLVELQRSLSAVPPGTFEHVQCYGLHGTYDDGLQWLKKAQHLDRPKCVISLGSSLGNFARNEAAPFLSGFATALGPKDSMLIGLDGCQDKDLVFHAYNDREGKTHEFIRNGLTHANTLIGREVFKQHDWEVIGEYDAEAGRHQASYVSKENFEFDGVWFKAGECVRVEESYKYSPLQRQRLWEDAGLVCNASFGEQTGQYQIHMLSVPTFSYPLIPEKYAPNPIPSLHEFEQLWAAWDTITKGMIPKEELLSQPIKLRNCCLFYLGHIPTFLDIHLTRATNSSLTEPKYFRQIFERGIDPDVDDPEKCHAHSEIPDMWPPIEEILKFQDRVRERTRSLYKNKTAHLDQKVGCALWLGFEHEAMHLETLLYMLLQSDKTLPPPGISPDFEALANEARVHGVPNEWVKVPESNITIGLDDPEDNSGPVRYFGWDNEMPARSVNVPAFETKARPITNEEYARYLQQGGKDNFPASWTSAVPSVKADVHGHKALKKEVNGGDVHMNDDSKRLTDAYLDGKAVRTVYGLVPLKYALDWPIIASYDELVGCAEWMNGRIPTFEEARSIYSYVDQMKTKKSGDVLANTIPAVNGHLSNDGVEESPPSHHSRKSKSDIEQGIDPKRCFRNLEGCNVGFKHFHPLPVTQNGNRLSGQGDMGGAWEWTSSVLEKHDGFKAMDLYPGYTADFFDKKHNIVLGGSWATHPRIAGRKTFVNWYQRNYPYAWAGARLVRNV